MSSLQCSVALQVCSYQRSAVINDSDYGQFSEESTETLQKWLQKPQKPTRKPDGWIHSSDLLSESNLFTLYKIWTAFCICDLFWQCSFDRMRWVDPGWMPGAHKSRSVIPLLSWTGERKTEQKACGPRWGQWEITQQLSSRTKQTQLWGISLIYYQSNQSRVMRTKNKSPFLLHGLDFTPDSF